MTTPSRAAREAFLQEILALAPEYATGLQRGKNGIAHCMVWNEGNLRDALGIPIVPPAPVLFTIDVPYPIGCEHQFEVTAKALAGAVAAEAERGLIDGAFTHCQRLIEENTALKERIFRLEGGFTTGLPAIYKVAEEVTRARALHPGNAEMLIALTEEVGEVCRAVLDRDFEHAAVEAIQVACVAVRIAEEGDASWPALLAERRGTTEPVRHCAGLNEHEAQL